MKFSIIKVLALCLVCISSLHANPADLVKMCQNFKKTFLEACQMIHEDKYTQEMKFLKENLTTGGSVIFYGAIVKAINDCIAQLESQTDLKIEGLISTLKTFIRQIDSDFMYDLNTGTVVKKEITRDGNTRTLQLPYNETRCYKVALNINNPA